ncbi:tRNA-(guanine-N1)-methyltransferase [Paenibacillus sp. J45TS6]|uniref:nitrite reductase small subunit NirD n=1 Tax=unclassified Paenibacillus TaxID=185978 RepID=UPI001B2F4BEC|nr:nitrite reductase small subunit NirD [Paenibacillus sp. J45TS6]GIP44399.1 tRNA-(guanine-N1)-methyltransferase [Paenibacillus sp. J45TS6]
MSNTITEKSVYIGTTDEFLERVGRTVVIEDLKLAIFKTAEQIYALEDRNPHPKGGPLNEGIVSGPYVYDPLYDWKIDMRDGCVQAPDEGQVRTFPVFVEENKIYVTIS